MCVWVCEVGGGQKEMGRINTEYAFQNLACEAVHCQKAIKCLRCSIYKGWMKRNRMNMKMN